MKTRHKLIDKQIQSIEPVLAQLPEDQRQLFERLFDKISDAYTSYEDDHELLENSMEISSRELIENNREMRRMNETLRQQQASMTASAKMSALGEMAGGVAHEINNPLAIIQMLSGQIAEVIGDEKPDLDLLRSLALEIESTTDRMAKIVQGLRTFSRDGSKDPFQQVSVQRLIEETMALCQEKFKCDGTAITIEPLSAELFFDGRATEISQVLLNLLNNSNDAITDLPEKWVRLSASDGGDFVEIRVTDSGRGISPDVLSKVFQPFFTTKPIGKGTGLGLSISSGIVRAHNGELRFDSQSENTCFVIKLPKTNTPRH